MPFRRLFIVTVQSAHRRGTKHSRTLVREMAQSARNFPGIRFVSEPVEMENSSWCLALVFQKDAYMSILELGKLIDEQERILITQPRREQEIPVPLLQTLLKEVKFL